MATRCGYDFRGTNPTSRSGTWSTAAPSPPADVAVMAAAWAGAEVPESLRGVTTSMSVQFLAPARATDLIAIGRVLRRGKTLVNCDVDVVTPDGEAVAKAIATYKVG